MNNFEKNIVSIYGLRGKTWLNNLPNIINSCVKTYNLRNIVPISAMNFNYIATGYKREQPIILKLSPCHKALRQEAFLLKIFAKHGSPNILAATDGMILMQQAIPGFPLKEYFPEKEESAIKIVCQTINKLHATKIPENHTFSVLKDFLQSLNNNFAIPLPILTKARTLRDSLLVTTKKPVLLHGDLHHENILKHRNSWMVIDPKGFIGDPVFDVATFIYNPLPELLQKCFCKEIIHRRIELCSQLLKYCKQRIKDWLFIKIVLSWAWCLEDNLDATCFSHLTTIIEELR